MSKQFNHASGEAYRAPKFCTQCKKTKPAKGGTDITYANGLKRRWCCEDCKLNLIATNRMPGQCHTKELEPV